MNVAVPTVRPLAEPLENRVLLSAGITQDRWVLDALKEKETDPGDAVYVDTGLSDPAPSTPPTATSWDGVSFTSDGDNNSGWLHIPPDPNGAVGPNHVVNIVNCTIEWYTKSGSRQHSSSLGNQDDGTIITGSFFSSLNPANGLFDPKVLYDPYSGRFLVVALEQVGSAQTSRALFAVSDDSDPNGTWYFQSINTVITNGGRSYWFDYPGVAVGNNAIYLTGNMFRFNGSGSLGSRLWIIDKSGLYAGGTSTYNIYDPGALTGVGTVYTLQPAQMFGTAPGSVGTYLVASGFSSGAIDELSVIAISNPLSSPTFTNTYVALGDITSGTMPGAPQLGSSTSIEAGDGRVYSAVWRNNNLYAADLVNPPNGIDAGQATAHWFRMNASSTTVSLADQGNIGGEDIAPATATYYPAINVNSYGDVAIGFAASSSTTYVGAYYTLRLASDPAGTVQPTATLAAGVDYYVRTFGGGRNRWGDYSGMAVDPADDATFWVYNEYATTRGTVLSGEDGRWATRWGSFAVSRVSATPGVPDLDSSYDTGISNSDNLTKLNNSGLSAVLLFNISGTFAGAFVEVIADGNVIGSATASGTSTGVLTSGGLLLTDGTHYITARQTEAGKALSPQSTSLAISVDATAPSTFTPTVNDGSAQRSMVVSITESFSEEVILSSSGTDLRTRTGGVVPNVSISLATADNITYLLTFGGSAIVGKSLPDGMFQLLASAAGVQDRAGNALTTDYSYRFHRLFGDSDGDRDVDSTDIALFRRALNRPANYSTFWYFDFDANGSITTADLQQIKARSNRRILA